MSPDNLVVAGPSVSLSSGQADIDKAARARRSINTKRWRRDAGIAEIVDYFDRDNKNSIDQLNAKEVNVIVEQVARCRKDFVYAARNYFWITNKDTGDQLFSLWESQELILEEIIRLKARGRAQKLIVLKARQLGISTLVEALIAWNTMFFENTNAIIVSRDGSHASYLFNTIVLHIYDLLPWWLKPMIDSRQQDDGLVFDNPDQVARRINPGLVSRIDIQAATQQGGIGQGRRISAAHISELGDWPEDIAREAIEGDLRHALAERSVRTFAVIESTAKGAGTYYHKLWNSSVALGDKASWSTIFLPWFFEKTRFIAPEQGWHPVKQESELRERVKDEWVRCDNEECGRWLEASTGPTRLEDTKCPHCKPGTLRNYILNDGQLRFIWEERINAEKDKQSAKEFRQELCSTAIEAFQVSGYQLFSVDIQDYVDRCVRIPQAKGFIDAKGRFHGVKVILDGENRISQIRCWDDHCLLDHRYDPTPLWIWEFPRTGAGYCCGSDVAEGLGGDADYSVGWMNRIGQAPAPDVHVATYRSNTIDPISFAFVLNVLGRWYNEAMMCIEYNKFDTCANNVRYQFQYPNLFRWKHLDNARDPLANKFHWYTQYNTKPRLWQTAVKWLRAGLWVPRDETFASEIKTFQKEDYEDRGGSHASGFHDDVAISAMISLYCSHDMDWSEDSGTVVMRSEGTVESSGDYHMKCRCGHEWDTDNPDSYTHPHTGCPRCRNIILSAKRLSAKNGHSVHIDWDLMEREITPEDNPRDYNSL